MGGGGGGRRGNRSKTPDKGFSLTGNRVPVRTMEFEFGVRILLGEGGGTFVRWSQRRM